MKKSIILILLATLAMVSCNKDYVVHKNNGSKIEIRTAIDTRATEIKESDLNSFSVNALYEDGRTYFEDTFTREDENSIYFVSDKDYYWPADEDLTFIAYYPTMENVTINGEEKVITGYTPDADIAQQIDFITAVKKANIEDSADGVALEFKHQLSQIEVNGKNTNKGYTIKVKAIRLKNVAKSGNFDFVAPMVNWEQSDELTSYEIEFANEITLGEDLASLMGGKGNAMLIPQTRLPWGITPSDDDAAAGEGSGDDDDQSVEEPTSDPNGTYIAFYINAFTESGSKVYPRDNDEYGWVALPIAFNWAAGYKYTYNCDFSEGLGVVAPEEEGDEEGEEIFGNKINVDASFSNWKYDNNSSTPLEF